MSKARAEISARELKALEGRANLFLKNYKAEVMAEVELAGVNMQRLAKQNLLRNRTNNEGVLSNSIQIYPSPATLSVVVSSNAPYSFNIEYGTKPGTRPDFDKLMRWVRIKLKVPAKKLWLVTSNIEYKIFKHGTKPQPYMVPAKEVARRTFRMRMNKIIKTKG